MTNREYVIFIVSVIAFFVMLGLVVWGSLDATQ